MAVGMMSRKSDSGTGDISLSITWTGDQVSINNITSPHLTPTVSWNGDKLVVGGVEGPSLLGPSPIPTYQCFYGIDYFPSL